eukprot:1158818-Pelagomonas_calceolata.AAC.10
MAPSCPPPSTMPVQAFSSRLCPLKMPGVSRPVMRTDWEKFRCNCCTATPPLWHQQVRHMP